MDILITIAVLLLTLAVLIAVHEFGHFWVARRCGIKVLRFSIGFGTPLWRWRDSTGTEYSVAAVPLGGYVKMLDEREGEVPEELLGQAFNRKPPLQRIAVVVAGPAANLVLALFAYWCLFVAGETGYAPVVGEVKPGSIAEVAGLESGQEIVAVDGEETPTVQALSFALLERIGDTGTMTFAVKYPQSSMVYQSEAHIERWLSDQEEPDLFAGLGIELWSPGVLPVVSEVVSGSAAERAGLQPDDRIVSVDGTPITDGEEWVEYVRARPGVTIQLGFERGGESMTVPITPAEMEDDGKVIGRVGVGMRWADIPPEMIRKFDRGPLEAAGEAFARTWDMVAITAETLKKMVTGLISPKNLSGPITIAKVATASAKSGLESYISFLAFLSVSLGVLNLLPIPVLDGGHLLFYSIELLAGRPVPEKIQSLGYQVGLFLVLGMMMLALYNDFTRL